MILNYSQDHHAMSIPILFPCHTLYVHPLTYPQVGIHSGDGVDGGVESLTVCNGHTIGHVLENWWELVSLNIDHHSRGIYPLLGHSLIRYSHSDLIKWKFYF